MSNTDFNSLNPLPIADRNSELQQLSIKAFNTALPIDKFTFRHEPIDDAGVDGSLELKINGKSTNLRAQIQLKGTDSEETNQDASISLQVATTNLNYLLNGHSPLYILYVAPRNELYFSWARDESKRIGEINPTWRQQQSVTIRFKNLLNDEAIKEIHQRIRDEAQMQRQIYDILNSASNIENAIIGINPETLEVTDSESAKVILLTSGRLIVTAGYPEKIRSLSKLLDEESEKLPLILLIKAYAEEMLGKYQNAYALLSEVLLNRDSLKDDDKQFLDFLRKNCEYLTGRITLEEFSTFLNNYKDELSGHIAQSFRINQLRYRILTTVDPYQRPEVVSELTKLIQQILSDSSSSNVFKLYAESVWIEVEGLEIATGSFRDLAANDIRISQGFTSNISEIARKYDERLRIWLVVRARAIREAERLNHRSLLASLKFSSAFITYHQLTSNYSLALLLHVPIELFFEDIYKADVEMSVKTALELLYEAIELFQQIDNMEGEIRARLLIADFYEFTGKVSEAQEIAKNVLPKADALGYIRQVEHAKEHIAGNGLKARLNSSRKESTPAERELENANWTDEKVHFLVAQMVRIYGLPDDRYPVMEREYFSIRDIAKEKLNWCRYIELWQDKRHFLSRNTLFEKDPNRLCVCNLHHYQSIIHNPDWKIIIPAFKKTYCEKCLDRNPLQSEN